ncbi:MAG: hypothetical protein GX593_13105 [Actinomycetales bacterium]|nr:hypothetical protein [Actinomycetales bacterium]
MTTSFPRPADPSIPFPAIHREGHTEWKPPRSAGEVVVWSVILLVLAALAVVFALDTEQFALRVYRPAMHIPLWVLVVPVALVVLGFLLSAAKPPAPWYQEWSYVEAIEEGDGLRLFVGRLGKNHPGILARRGDTIELSATRGGEPDDNELRVWVSGQMLEVRVDAYLPGLTYAPLDAAAQARGITVVRARTAEAIPAP